MHDDDRTLLQDPDRTLLQDGDKTLLQDGDATRVHDGDRTLLQDDDLTVRMPSPGGRPTALPPRPAPRAAAGLHRRVVGVNPLLEAAATLLALIARLRATDTAPEPQALRAHLLARIAEFEARAEAAGAHRTRIGAARYLLCSFADEAIASTPWGASGLWAERTLLQEFHDERWGGRKTFELLDRLQAEPSTQVDLLELFQVCIALGYEGRWRDVPGGREQLAAISQRLQQTVRAQRPPTAAPRVLSLQVAGAVPPQPSRWSRVPPWTVAAAGALAVVAIVLVTQAHLEAVARPAFQQIHAMAAALQTDRAGAPARPRLAAPLQALVAEGRLSVRDERLRSVVTLPADGLFLAGTARIAPDREAALVGLAAALRAQPGEVAVIGHTDAAPLASLQFPSHWHLSRAQAQAVMDALLRHGVPRERLRAEGRADAEPLAPMGDAAQRARNRRVEVELRLPRPEAQ